MNDVNRAGSSNNGICMPKPELASKIENTVAEPQKAGPISALLPVTDVALCIRFHLI